MSVGEVVDDPPLPRQQEYTAPPNGLHTAYGFHFLTARSASPALFAEAAEAWANSPGWPSWSLGNHDVARFASRLARSGDPREARVLMAALLCLRGTIFLYQGEELGLPQAKVPFAALKDPYDIAAWPAGVGRDGARTPMPWTREGPAAGFSTSETTWLPVDPAHRPLAADVQEADPDSFLHFTRRLIALRRGHAALRWGEARVLAAEGGVFAIERRLGEERLVCAFNLSGEEASYESGGGLVRAEDFLGGALAAGGRVRLGPFAGAILTAR